VSQQKENGHASVSFGPVGLHWVTSRDTFAVPYDFVVRSKSLAMFVCCGNSYREESGQWSSVA
jgi:hypothetical protein